jgi:hypothetical protein
LIHPKAGSYISPFSFLLPGAGADVDGDGFISSGLYSGGLLGFWESALVTGFSGGLFFRVRVREIHDYIVTRFSPLWDNDLPLP